MSDEPGPSGPNFERDYWDLTQLSSIVPARSRFQSYVDWEGFTSVEAVADHLDWLKTVIGQQDEEDKQYSIFCADLTLHWVYENIDQGDYTPTLRETEQVYWAFFSTLTTRHIMKSYQFEGDPNGNAVGRED